MLGLLIGVVIGAIVSGFVIWLVAKMNLGLEVDGFGAAFIAAIIIAVISGIVTWLLGVLGITVGGGFLGAIVSLLVSAVVLMISDKFVPGMRVNGFAGALVAAVAIGILSWLIGLVLGNSGLIA